jgi:hypothetical protein
VKTPELVIVDGAARPALAALWSDMVVQRCTVHKHRNFLHGPDRLHEEVSAHDIIYADSKRLCPGSLVPVPNPVVVARFHEFVHEGGRGHEGDAVALLAGG